jgi:hypothetical protein
MLRSEGKLKKNEFLTPLDPKAVVLGNFHHFPNFFPPSFPFSSSSFFLKIVWIVFIAT